MRYTIDPKLIKFKSKLSRFTNIKNRNRKFHSLNVEEKRKEIAWDIINMIENNTLKGSSNSYWGSALFAIKNKVRTSEELQEKFCDLDNSYYHCYVCGRGALMLSRIRLGNSLNPTLKDISKGSCIMTDCFSFETYENIEREYEWDNGGLPYESNTTEKLLNIFCNVLVNGTFKVVDDTNYLISK